MSSLRLEELCIPAAEVGPENPLPPLAPPCDLHASLQAAPDIPAEDQRYVGFGRVPGCLPYRLQDGYRRERRVRPLRVAVLENETLKATFLLEYGGRLYSLKHKPSGRELVEVNPVFQPANLAIRNAWFSGGVEWNIGLIGHCPFTCSPLFAARVEGHDGTPVLRLYEWERIRRVPFQLDISLPDDSQVLFVRVRITNPNTCEVPMYWWSNMAVPETADTRVLAPADCAYRLGGGPNLQRVPIPYLEDRDASYPLRNNRAMDFFFRIPDGKRPWETALDGNGRGLVQTSTARLKGRKLFVWGNGPGGDRWQEFLSVPGRRYCEIQAGLAWTQAEHLPMPAGAVWDWQEAYGLMEAPPSIVHGADWARACGAVAERLEKLIPQADLESEFERGRAVADRPPAELLQSGSGWGALEQARRQAAGEPPMCGAGLVFPASTLGADQEPWLALLGARGETAGTQSRGAAPGTPAGAVPAPAPGNALGDTDRGAGRCRGAVGGTPRTPVRSQSQSTLPKPRLTNETGGQHGTDGTLPCRDPADGPGAFMVQDEWRQLLEASLKTRAGDHWLAWLHAGVMRSYTGDLAAAADAFRKSVEACRNVWAVRCLAVLARLQKQPQQAAALYREAMTLQPDLAPLAVECALACMEAGEASAWLDDILPLLPSELRNRGRLRLIEGRAALAAGRLEHVAEILAAPPTVDDMLEGEVSLSELWFNYHEQRLSRTEKLPVDDALKARVRRDFPPPAHIDFRMVT